MFLEGLKTNIKNNTFCIIADGFHNFWLPFCEEIQNKVSGYFYEIIQ